MPSSTDGMYYDFSIPLGLANLIEDVIAKAPNNPNAPSIVIKPAQRQWFSQPRISIDNTTEVVQVNFKEPSSISELAFQALRVSVHIEMWYQDRLNNWRQMKDKHYIPVGFDLSAANAGSWYAFHTFVYPIVAKAIQFRLTRKPDLTLGNSTYVVGIQDALIRRNVYTRSDGTQALGDEQDKFGNVITKSIVDWDGAQAVDNDPNTFWKSEPMPDPSAVASLFLDVRATDGSAQLIDTVAIDPVFTGQTVNLYYSTDDTIGTRKLSAVSLPPTTNQNTNWQLAKGIWDISTDTDASSSYLFPVRWGPLVSQDCWIGMEWAPDFNPTSGPALNPVLFEVTPTAPDGSQYWPKISYDVGASEIVLELQNGTTTQSYRAAISPLFTQYNPLRIVVGWKYNPDTVFISVTVQDGTEIAHVVSTPGDLPSQVTLDGQVGFAHFRGLFTANIVKLEDYNGQYSAFQANPAVYVNPDPVQPDTTGRIPSTSLDNAIYAVDWTLQDVGCGGSHESAYENKEWTPVWKNYFSSKGKLVLPQQISMKYLKLEFSNLTEQPYPIYDSGIQFHYKVFPVAVIQQCLTASQRGSSGSDGSLGLGGNIVLSGIQSVNWLNPSTIQRAVNAQYGQTTLPVQVTTGPGVVTGSLPNTAQVAINNSTRVESANPYVYRRRVSDGMTLAKNAYNVINQGEPLQGMPSVVNQNWAAINRSTVDTTNPGSNVPPAVAIQGQDWWVFPGQTLKIPANVIQGLTNSETTTARSQSLATRVRFPTTSVHRYDTKTATRDAAVAYFAGVREVQAYTTSYVAEEDPVSFYFSNYDSSHWTFTGINKLSTGPITNQRNQYLINNPNFDTGLNNWDIESGGWVWDGNPLFGRFNPGTATTIADGTNQNMVSDRFDVQPTWDVSVSVWVFWTDLVASSGAAIQLNGVGYHQGEIVGTVNLGQITYSDWSTHASCNPAGANNGWIQISGNYTVPTGVDQVAVCLTVTNTATAGQVWYDTVLPYSTDDTEATIYKDLITTSTFARVECEFFDSGVKESDGMWSQMDPLDTNISNIQLAYYTSTIPSIIPAGVWSDSFHEWGDVDIAWGTPRAVVAIDVDPNRIFDNKRVLHFSRAAGAEEAGIAVRQITNFVANGLFRINAVFYKPNANGNQITVQLRRVSDGVFIFEETINPVVGYWYTYQSHFQEIPDSPDQEYEVILVCSGDEEDELFLNDLRCEIAQIRYFAQLGGSSAFLHDITELAYADNCYVSCTTPVSELTVQATLLTDRSFAYGCRLTPQYLK